MLGIIALIIIFNKEAIAHISLLAMLTYGVFVAYPFLSFIFFIFFIFLLFCVARKRDKSAKQFTKKSWFLRNIRQLLVVIIAVLGLAFWGFKAIEKSENELFNQLVEIMENNVPTSKTSYNKDISELVCPLVDADKLAKMMQDEYAKKRMEYREGSVFNLDDDTYWPKWEIKLMPKRGLSTIYLNIRYNKNNNACSAYISMTVGI